MSELMQCWRCRKFSSKNLITGDKATIGGGFCKPKRWVMRHVFYRTPACKEFEARGVEDADKIERWLKDKGF